MMLRIRVVVPDKPGSLAAVTAVIAGSSADVVAIDVLGADGADAVDDITVKVPDTAGRERVLAQLGQIPGVVIESVRTTHALPGHRQDLEAIRRIAADPTNGLAIFATQLPLVVQADWAVIAAAGVSENDTEHMVKSVGAPIDIDLDLPSTGLLSARAVSGRTRPSRGAIAPLGANHIVIVVREAGPRFRRQELVYLQRLSETVAMLATMPG